MNKAKDIVKYIQAHECPMVAFLMYLSNLELKMYGSTKFAINFLMIDRLVKIKHVLKQMDMHIQLICLVNQLSWGRSVIEAHQKQSKCD
jgi:hypothetical protein